jgi:cytochrome c biogenesis protein CcdA
LPPGWMIEPLQFPVPDRLTVLGLMNYVYESDHALLTRIQAPRGVAPGAIVPVRARLDYLVCTNELCVPEQAIVTAQLRVGMGTGASADFSAYRQRLPRPLAAPARFELSSGEVRIGLGIPTTTELDSPYFYPATLEAIGHSARQSVSRNGDFLIVETAAGPKAGALTAIEGVLEIAPGIGLSFVARPGPVPAAGTPVPTVSGDIGAPSAQLSTLLVALLGALAGGLLLNIMPCVFPILSLKALSLARSGETQEAARNESLAYAGGVILTCLLLGAVLLGLRSAGESAGWAFQLQEPKIIFLLLLLVTAIALNLAGLFALPAVGVGDSAAASGGVRGAFFTGALAAFVATPCTGPFLGFALGAALVLPTLAALAVFAGLGIGLALPFLLLGFVPALRRRLPKPGPWMARFQRILSVPMFATALGLAWILGRQSGVDGMTLGLAAALSLGLGLWWLGRRSGRRTLLPLALVLIAVIAPLPFVRTSAARPPAGASGLAAEPFSEARLTQLRSAGTPVFLYFTADWCLTCKVNEKAALEQEEVAQAFRDKGIKVLVGDWTRGDQAIGRFLERHGRSGVPLYLFYGPGREPEILPQILTVGRLARLGGR